MLVLDLVLSTRTFREDGSAVCLLFSSVTTGHRRTRATEEVNFEILSYFHKFKFI